MAAGGAAVLAVGVLGVYLVILRSQDSGPPLWVLALFFIGVGASVAAAVRPSDAVLLGALVTLGLLMLLSLLSIGVLFVPSVVLLAVAYAARRERDPRNGR